MGNHVHHSLLILCRQLTLASNCLQTEPAISVRADPDFTAAQSSDAAALQQNAEEPSEDHPPEFKSAARQEHMDEAAAIRRQMQVGSATCICACLAMQCMHLFCYTALLTAYIG